MNKKLALKALVVYAIGSVAGYLFEHLTGKSQCSKEGLVVAVILALLLVAVEELIKQIKLRKTIKE